METRRPAGLDQVSGAESRLTEPGFPRGAGLPPGKKRVAQFVGTLVIAVADTVTDRLPPPTSIAWGGTVHPEVHKESAPARNQH